MVQLPDVSAEVAVATSVTMCPRESLRLVTKAHRHMACVCRAVAWLVAKTEYRHCQAAGELYGQLLCNDGFMSAVALGECLSSLTHRAGIPVPAFLVIHSYVKIT